MALIKVKIISGSNEESIVWNHESDVMLLYFTHNSSDGMVNEYITEYLSIILKIPKEKVNVLKGHDLSCKIIEIDNDLSSIKEKIFRLNSI